MAIATTARAASFVRASAGLRPHGRLLDPIVVGAVSLVVYALHGYQGVLDRDLGVFTYGGEHVAHGIPPYVGIFNSVGPLADAVPGLAIWAGHLVGLDPILSARLLFTVLSALCCALVCVLARDTFGSRAAGLVAPAIFLIFERFLELASDGPREKTTMLVFLLLAMVLVGRRRWLAAGVCAALATLTWQPALAVAGAALVAAVLVDRRGGLRAVTRFVAGGALPSIAFLVYFVATGALRPALQGFVLVNLLYTSQPSAVTSPIATWQMLWTAYHVTLIVALVGLAALVTLAVRALPYVRRPDPDAPPTAGRIVVSGVAGAVGTAWTVAAVNGGPDLFILLPFAALGLTGVTLLLAARAPRHLTPWVVTAVVVAGVTSAGVESVASRNNQLVGQRADIRAVLATQPAGAQVVSIDAPQVLALAGRTNPTPYQLFDGAMEVYLDHTQPGGIASFAARISQKRPTFIVVGTSFDGTWGHQLLADDYWRVGRGQNWTWYLSRSAGAHALLRARAAHDEAMAAYGR